MIFIIFVKKKTNKHNYCQIKMKYSWKTYNLKKELIFQKKSSNLLENKFNYIENGLYNHIRDIFCIGLLLLDKKKIK